MNLTIPLMSLLILNFTPVAALNLPCATRNDRTVSYQLREKDRRCEGVQPINIISGKSLLIVTRLPMQNRWHFVGRRRGLGWDCICMRRSS